MKYEYIKLQAEISHTTHIFKSRQRFQEECARPTDEIMPHEWIRHVTHWIMSWCMNTFNYTQKWVILYFLSPWLNDVCVTHVKESWRYHRESHITQIKKAWRRMIMNTSSFNRRHDWMMRVWHILVSHGDISLRESYHTYWEVMEMSCVTHISVTHISESSCVWHILVWHISVSQVVCDTY